MQLIQRCPPPKRTSKTTTRKVGRSLVGYYRCTYCVKPKRQQVTSFGIGS
jgi:hypothetical protein